MYCVGGVITAPCGVPPVGVHRRIPWMMSWFRKPRINSNTAPSLIRSETSPINGSYGILSKEYRGYMWRELFICCPNERVKQSWEIESVSGYTPASSEVPEDPANTLSKRLNDYHKDHQNIGSVATGILAGPIGRDINAIPGAATSDQFEDAVALIRKLCPPTNEDFSHGEMICPPQVLTADCVSGTWEFYVRVGMVHNLLNFGLTQKLIAYQGGTMRFKLCCDGKLKLSYSHTAIPSWRLYVNNRIVGSYGMLTATWAEVEASFFEITRATVFEGSQTALERELKDGKKAPKVKTWEKEFAVRRHDGCPVLRPSDIWPDDSV